MLAKLFAPLKREKWVLIFGQPYDLRFLLLQLAVLVLIVAAVIGGYFYTSIEISKRRDYVADESAELGSKLAYTEASTTPPPRALEDIMLFHENALGYDKVNSLHVRGEMFDGQTTVEMKIMAKPPGSYYQSLEMDDKTLEVRFVNGQLEYDQNSALIDSEDERLAEINKVLMVMECAIPLPAWLYADSANNSYLTRKYDEVFNGRPCAVVENNILDNTTLRHYIDLDSGQELSRQSEVDGYRLRVDYKELKKVNEASLPVGYGVFLDDKFVSEAKLEKIQINRGLPSFLFKQ